MSSSSGSFLSLGHNYRVPLELFSTNRSKLWKSLGETFNGSGGSLSDYIVVLRGGPAPSRYDTDHEPVFRQESYFWWLTGVKEPDCAVILLETETILLVPHLPPDYATVMGPLRTLQEWKKQYQVDHVLYTHQLESYLLNILLKQEVDSATSTCNRQILLLKGPNTDSGNMYETPHFESSQLKVRTNETRLFPILAECRVHKSPLELQLLEHVTQISSLAHAYVMRNVQPGMWEYQCESLFRHYAYYNYGSRLVSYTSICGCGPNAAILHYGHAGEPNARQLQADDNCLFDMGAEYQCYASDITCSFPVSGKFSDRYRPIYQAVLEAQVAVYDMARPGVSWLDCHKRAEEVILEHLVQLGLVILHGNVEVTELVKKRLGAVFMPHGMGHFLGIDTHDVGGYLPGHPVRSLLPGLKKLRTARVLHPSMVLTVEPGCYFIDHLLDGALADPELRDYLNAELLETYRGYGGVRLEDVICITQDGCVNFTICPRTVSEVEHVMSGGKWPPLYDEAPFLRRVNLTTPILIFGPPPSK